MFENVDKHIIASNVKIFQVTRLIMLKQPTKYRIEINVNKKTEE